MNYFFLRHCLRSSLLVLFFLLPSGMAWAGLSPPEQDMYLRFYQRPEAVGAGENFGSLGAGTIAWAETAGTLTLTTDFTVEAWLLWDDFVYEAVQTASGVDMDTAVVLCGQRSFGLLYGQAGIPGWNFFVSTEFGGRLDVPSLPLPRAEWAHFAATYDGDFIRVYINGSLAGEVENFGAGPLTEVGFPFDEKCFYQEPEVAQFFAVGSFDGFTGGMRQLRVWNRALSVEEIFAGASRHLTGNEAGLVSYWPMHGPFFRKQAVNWVPGGSSLQLGWPIPPQAEVEPSDNRPDWSLVEPIFEIREDLIEDVVMTECNSAPDAAITLDMSDLQNDGDLDLVYGGTTTTDPSGTGCWSSGQAVAGVMIREGASGFIVGTSIGIVGPPPLTHGGHRTTIADFNGDGIDDWFSGNGGHDFCDDMAGGINKLLLSRPDGLFEDATGNLLGSPCSELEEQFPGQNPCLFSGGALGRPPGPRYPGPGAELPLAAGSTHGVASGDIDGDDDIDVVVGNKYPHGIESPYVLMNDGSGGFSADWERLPDYIYGPRDPNGIPVATGTTDPSGYLLSDLDGDGHIDLVTGPSTDQMGNWVGGISWNDGSGDFSASSQIILEAIPAGITGDFVGTMVAADVDLDEDVDLVLHWSPEDIEDQTVPGAIQILVNQGGRTFSDETLTRVGTPPHLGVNRSQNDSRIFVMDTNTDSCPDIVLPRDESKALDALILVNDCSGNFAPSYESVLTKRLGRYYPFDYEGDGDIDFINAQSLKIGLADDSNCRPNEGGGGDYIDFSILLNVNPAAIQQSPMLRSGFER